MHDQFYLTKNLLIKNKKIKFDSLWINGDIMKKNTKIIEFVRFYNKFLFLLGVIKK